MKSQSKRHHVVIGDGVTAAEFAINTAMQAGECLTIIGPEVHELGRGLAYGKVADDRPWHLAYLLNSPSESVDLGFGRWVCENWLNIREKMQGRHPDWLAAGQTYIQSRDYAALNAPRELFGDYLNEHAEKALGVLARRGIVIRRIAARVSDICYKPEAKEDAQPFLISLETGKILSASHIDIATGGAQTQSLFQADGERSFDQLYGNEDVIAERVQRGGAVVCLGSNAAMLDALRFCQSVLPDDQRVNFVAVSPRAQLPEALIPSQPRRRAGVVLDPPYASAADFYASLAAQIERLHQQGYRMAEIRGPFKAAILRVGLQTLVPDTAESRKVLGLMERLFLRGTRDSLLDFAHLRSHGQVRLIPGKLEYMEMAGGRLKWIIRGADGLTETLDAAALVNCAGAGHPPRFDPLTEKLLEKGWLRRCPVSAGLEVGKNLAIGPEGVRYLAPSVSVIGDQVQPFALYDAGGLREAVRVAVNGV